MKFAKQLLYVLGMPPLILFFVGGFFSLIGLHAIGVLASILLIGGFFATLSDSGRESPIDEETQRRIWHKELSERPKKPGQIW